MKIEPADSKLWYQMNGDNTYRINYNLNPNSIVVDIGARHGNWSDLIKQRYGCNVYCFEAVKEFCEQLKLKNYIVFNYAVVDDFGTIDLGIFEGRSRRVQDGRVLYTIGQSTLLDVYKRTGYKGEMCTHGFRSVFSTLANRYRARGLHPYDEATIEMQLAHVKEKVKGAYNRDEYIIPRHGLMQWWADFLDTIRGRGIVGDFDGVSATLDCAAE